LEKDQGIKFQVLNTSLFIREGDNLKQVLSVKIENNRGTLKNGKLKVDMPEGNLCFDIPLIIKGINVHPISIPEVDKPTPATYRLIVGSSKWMHKTVIERKRHWKIHLIPFSHHDIGYTDLQPVVVAKHKRYFDKIIEYCRQSEDYPEEARFRWTCDTAWAVKNYLDDPRTRNKDFLELVRKGKIEVTALFAALSSPLVSSEELIRSLYYTFELKRKYRVPIKTAMTTDIPGHPWIFPQLLSKAGIRYLSTAVNQAYSQNNQLRAKAPCLPRPFYWESPDGSRVLVWNADLDYTYLEGFLLGCVEDFRKEYKNLREYVLSFNNEDLTHLLKIPDRALPEHLELLKKKGYPYDAIQLRAPSGILGDNLPPTFKIVETVREWNKQWAYPKLIISTNAEFFQYIEATYHKRFPCYKGDWTDWWADGPASSAYETGLNRITHEELASAEKFSSLAFSINKEYDYPSKDINKAYQNVMLFDEHTWGMHDCFRNPHFYSTKIHWRIKSSFAYDASWITRDILKKSLTRIASNIKTEDKCHYIAVFNPLSWPRTDLLNLSLPLNICNNGNFKIIDVKTDESLPYQIIDYLPEEKIYRIMFIARKVPPLGYKSYKILPHVEKISFDKGEKGGNSIENSYYKISLDPESGGVVSIFDKELKQELVDKESSYKVNEYVYDRGEPPLNKRFFPARVKEIIKKDGPLSESLIAISTGKMAPSILQEIRLYKNIKKIDFINTINKKETLMKEGIYYAFPFNINKGEFKLDVPGAILRPQVDQLPGTCRDWYSFQHWLDVSTSDYGLVFSSRETGLVSLGGINTGKWLEELSLTNTNFFIYIMNNYWNTNFRPGQGGKLTFHFSLFTYSGKFDVLRSTRLGWGYSTPLVPIILKKNQKGILPLEEFTFCQVDKPNVMVIAIKQAEDKKGYIIRLHEFSGQESIFEIKFPFLKISRAYQTNIVEENIGSLKVKGSNIITLPIKDWGIETIRIIPV